jgi:hypothetical protein
VTRAAIAGVAAPCGCARVARFGPSMVIGYMRASIEEAIKVAHPPQREGD